MSNVGVRIHGESQQVCVVHAVKIYNKLLTKDGIWSRFTIDYSFRMSHNRIRYNITCNISSADCEPQHVT